MPKAKTPVKAESASSDEETEPGNTSTQSASQTPSRQKVHPKALTMKSLVDELDGLVANDVDLFKFDHVTMASQLLGEYLSMNSEKRFKEWLQEKYRLKTLNSGKVVQHLKKWLEDGVTTNSS